MLATLHYNPLIIQCSSNSNKRRKAKNKKPNKYQINQNKLSFTPTPLIIKTHQTQKAQSKIQALETVVHDIEQACYKNGVNLDSQTLYALLETCHKLNAISHAIRVHKLIPRRILSKNVEIGLKLMVLYVTNGLVEDAHHVFDELSERDECVFAWNLLVYGYAEIGKFEDALAIYFQMVEEGVELDVNAFRFALRACSGIGLVHVGEEIHRHVVRYGVFDNVFVGNELVDMYAKCGDIVRARKVFDRIDCKDSVSWNVMVTAYMQHGLLEEALEVFRCMIGGGFEPDEASVEAMLSGISSLRLGKQIHAWILRRGLHWSLPLMNSLMVLYSLHSLSIQVRWLFSNMSEKDVVSWNSIISAHRDDPRALTYFKQMEDVGEEPDAITFISLLSTCAHLGLVTEGKSLFSRMRDVYNITPSMEHYACMVDLYGRAGLLAEAYELIARKKEFKADPTVWVALLIACSLHANVEIGEVAARKLFELEPENLHNFELLMKIYANVDRLDDVETVRNMMLRARV